MCDENVLSAGCGGGFSQVLSVIKMYQIVQFKHMQFIPQLSPFLKRQDTQHKAEQEQDNIVQTNFHECCEQMIHADV